MKKALIIGAGPAGLTAAYELLKQTKDLKYCAYTKKLLLDPVEARAIYTRLEK